MAHDAPPLLPVEPAAADALPGAAPRAAASSGSRRPSRTTVVISIAAVVVAALATVGGIVAFRGGGGGDGPQGRRISLPDSAGSYQLIRALPGSSVSALFGDKVSALGPVSQALGTAQIGVYRVSGTASALPTLIFFGFNRADSAPIARLLSGGTPAQVTTELLSHSVAAPPRGFAPGPLGGSLQCTQASSSGTPFTPCAWADGSTVALVLRVGTVDVTNAADVARGFRAAAER